MTHSDSWRLDAADLSARIAARELRPIELLDESLRRIERLDPLLRVFVHLDRDGARKAAEAATERQQHGERLGPLDGIPVTVKDNLFVVGLPARWGSQLFQDHVPARDDIVVERLRAAGAVIVGKTTTPEFALSGRTQSIVSGVTRNPWDVTLTPGGSSGGAAAAVATGIAPLAIGTDAGGSIRTPASYTGLVGFRPSNGRIPRRYGFPPTALDFQAIGLAARTMRDLDLLYGIASGPDPRDPASLCMVKAPIRQCLRIGWFTSAGSIESDVEVSDAIEASVGKLAELGCAVERTTAPYDPGELGEIWEVISSAAVTRIVMPFGDECRALLTEPMRELVKRGERRLAADYVQAMDRLAAFRADLSVSWGSFDLIVTPTTPAPAWPAELEAPAMIGGRKGSAAAMGAFCGWVNVMGFPAISVPVEPHPDGRPIGMQIIGRFGADEAVLDLARRWEAHSPWSGRWPAMALEP